MKSKIIATALLAATTTIGYSTTSYADETCHDVSGSVSTENVTPTIQIGDISLEMGAVFSETGSLVGNITGSDGFFTTFLSHKARFPQGDSFVTKDDTAVPDFQYYGNPVRTLDVDGNACSYWITENITHIERGTGFFKNVTTVNVTATGYISNCPDENKNSFVLSGTLCVE
ncbi:MAG: hypothetical protein V7700_11565 [Halioglobus sp.]